LPDIDTLNRLAREGTLSRTALLQQAQARAKEPAAQAVFLQTSFDTAASAAQAADAAALAGKPLHPLAGLPVSIKDLFDIGG
ncbi:amidase family protein, partial [Acinetobacter baumannii]